MWKCPECLHELTSLAYNVYTSSSEYGTAELSDHNQESNRDKIYEHECNDNGDTEWTDTPNYTCPECDNEIDLDDLKWVDEDEEDNEKTAKAGVRSLPARGLLRQTAILQHLPRNDGDNVACYSG